METFTNASGVWAEAEDKGPSVTTKIKKKKKRAKQMGGKKEERLLSIALQKKERRERHEGESGIRTSCKRAKCRQDRKSSPKLEVAAGAGRGQINSRPECRNAVLDQQEEGDSRPQDGRGSSRRGRLLLEGEGEE